MTHIICNTHEAPRLGFIERIRNTASRLTSYWRARASLHELQRLDDHILNDIGITRDDLNWAEYLPASRNPISELATCREKNIQAESPARKILRRCC